MYSQPITQIIWDGFDSYTELENVQFDCYIDAAGRARISTGSGSFSAFPAVRVALESVPMVNGERDFNGLFVTESGRAYRAV